MQELKCFLKTNTTNPKFKSEENWVCFRHLMLKVKDYKNVISKSIIINTNMAFK